MRWLMLGATLAAVAVGLGAFGAHGLRSRVDARDLEIFETAAHYHLVHAVALCVVGLLAVQVHADVRARAAADLAGWLLSAGIAIFSGSLYLLVASGQRKLGMITPLGGLAFIAGWAALARAAFIAGSAR